MRTFILLIWAAVAITAAAATGVSNSQTSSQEDLLTKGYALRDSQLPMGCALLEADRIVCHVSTKNYGSWEAYMQHFTSSDCHHCSAATQLQLVPLGEMPDGQVPCLDVQHIAFLRQKFPLLNYLFFLDTWWTCCQSLPEPILCLTPRAIKTQRIVAITAQTNKPDFPE